MGWITQSYEGNVHVVPDTEPGHVLGPDCFCVPAALMENAAGGVLVMHHDELDRVAPFDEQTPPSAAPIAPKETR
jgi:hypothetical protein